jgi:hypothetical protein
VLVDVINLKELGEGGDGRVLEGVVISFAVVLSELRLMLNEDEAGTGGGSMNLLEEGMAEEVEVFFFFQWM